MGIRKKTNRHDEWVRFRDSHKADFVALGLPEAVIQTKDKLVEFLSEGKFGDLDLSAMPDEDFLRLESLIGVYFFEGWQQVSWTVFSAERFRRFKRYG